MVQLTFTQTAANRYEATATVNGDFAIHLERYNRGLIQVSVSSVENKAYCEVFKIEGNENFDKDFQALVYPKYVCIASESEPKSDCYIVENSSEG